METKLLSKMRYLFVLTSSYKKKNFIRWAYKNTDYNTTNITKMNPLNWKNMPQTNWLLHFFFVDFLLWYGDFKPPTHSLGVSSVMSSRIIVSIFPILLFFFAFDLLHTKFWECGFVSCGISIPLLGGTPVIRSKKLKIATSNVLLNLFLRLKNVISIFQNGNMIGGLLMLNHATKKGLFWSPWENNFIFVFSFQKTSS